jgi:uncharacterized surface protein with fasciclin (FAS1) repeats
MKKSIITRALLALAIVVLGFTACQKEQLPTTPQEVVPEVGVSDGTVSDRSTGTIVDIAIGNPNFTALVAAVVKTSQVNFLSNGGLNATVLAPNDAAFAQLPAPFNNAANINAITNPATINTLRQILRYHVLPGRRTAAQFANGNYQTFNSPAMPNANLVTVGRSISNGVFINGNTQVIATDISATNGIIHVIDKVLLPPTQDIAQIAISNGNFTALVAALQKAGLANMASQPGNTTVFAPTDAAFAQLPAPLNNAANISAITDPATIALLRNVLRYHMVPARVFSVDLREGLSAPTRLAGSNVTISLANGPQVQGNGNPSGSNIVAVNLLARNGVIHVIDRVLLP